MNVYRIDDGATTWVVAHDREEALVVLAEQTAEASVAEYLEEYGNPEIKLTAATDPLTIRMVDDDRVLTKSCHDWAKDHTAPCVIACSEW